MRFARGSKVEEEDLEVSKSCERGSSVERPRLPWQMATGKSLVGVKKFCDDGGVGTHAEEHGNGFVDGSGRKLGKPGIADAPGSEGRDGERHRGRKLAADVLEERGVESVSACGGVEINLNGRNAGSRLQICNF